MAERIRTPSSSSRFPGLLITNLVFTDKKLGRGADATVYEVDWNGTSCAAKRLHDILLDDDSPGGSDRFIRNFQTECMTWSKLRHPGVVQFLGVYLEPNSRLPVLIMEKMDTSLRKYLEDHSKEQFPLHQKAFVLLQVSQALAYLHAQNPPLVHHDLSPNNVLLNVASFVTKLTDFGMSRTIDPSALSRKSSIKGTLAFMAPEALQSSPQYNVELDVFSFGNIILSTLTHKWPEPDCSTKYEGDKIVGLTELQRRERYVVLLTAQEEQLFLPTVRQCLENRPDKRPSSTELVRELKRIKSSLPRGGHVAAPIEQLHQQLSAKEEECRQKDEVLREKEEALAEKDEMILRKDDVIRRRDEALQHLDMIIREQDEALTEKDEVLSVKDSAIQAQQASNQAQHSEIQTLQGTIQALQAENEQLKKQPVVAQQVKHPPGDWRKLGECRKVIQHSPRGGTYIAVAVNSEGLLAVTDGANKCVHLLTDNDTLLRSIGKGVLSSSLYGVSFDLKGNVLVTDYVSSKIVKLSLDGRLLQTIHHAGRKSFINPSGVFVSPEGLMYICDSGNHRVTVHDEEGKFLFAFGSKGSSPGCFDGPQDIAFGSDGLVYVVDQGNERICVWSKEGTFKRDIKPHYGLVCIATTSDDHLLITSHSSSLHNVMVYSLEGQLIHQFGANGSDRGRLDHPWGICVHDDSGLVYVADRNNKRVQLFS